MRKRKKFLLFIIFILFLSFSLLLEEKTNLNNITIASEGRDLEIKYPEVRGLKPKKTDFALNEYVEYIFNFAVWGAGALAFLVIVISGSQYLISIESPEGKKNAKDRVTSALLGLVILISSVIVLNRIDEDLVKIPLPETQKPLIAGPGIWLCNKEISSFEPFMKGELDLGTKEREEKMEEIMENCYRLSFKSREPRGFKTKKVYVINPEDIKGQTAEKASLRYAVVLHKENNYTGDCFFAYKKEDVEEFDPESMTPLILKKEAEGEGVFLYNYRQCNEYVDEEDNPKPEEYESLANKGSGYSNINLIEKPNMDPCYSIKIDEPTNWIAITYKDSITNSQERGWCEVFDETNNNLMDVFTGQFCSNPLWERRPCVTNLQVLKGHIMDE
jgi:hypothetical protein